jgi:hypothetical protein
MGAESARNPLYTYLTQNQIGLKMARQRVETYRHFHLNPVYVLVMFDKVYLLIHVSDVW